MKSFELTSNISEPKPDSVLFSLIYELELCKVGDVFAFVVCRDERIKLMENVHQKKQEHKIVFFYFRNISNSFFNVSVFASSSCSCSR